MPGMVRVTLMVDGGEGFSAYYDPARLPECMRALDGKMGKPRDKMHFAKLRRAAMRYAMQPETAPDGLLVLLWLYFRNPTAPGTAAKVHEVLAEHGTACVAIFHHRVLGNTIMTVTPRFERGFASVLPVEMPDDFEFVRGMEEPHGTA